MISYWASPRHRWQAMRRVRQAVWGLRRSLLRERSLYLTIDDGPTEAFGQLLNVLGCYGAKATLFLIGNQVNQENIHLLGQAVMQGHTVANHTWSHQRFSLLDPGEIEQEIHKGDEALCAVFDAAGVDPASQPRYFRFPWFDPGYRPGYPAETRGHKANVKAAYRVLRSLDYRVAWWNIDSLDAGIADGRSTLAEAAQRVLRARAGDIVVMHDRPYAPELLESVLPSLTARWSLQAMPNGARGKGKRKHTYANHD